MVTLRAMLPWVFAGLLVCAFRIIDADRGTLIAIGVYGVAVIASKRVVDHLIRRRSPQLVSVGAPVGDVAFDDDLWDRPPEPNRAEYVWRVSFFYATVLALDAFWHTDWLDFATGTSRYNIVSDATAAVTITITMICVVGAFFGPLLMGAYTYVEARAELVRRRERGGTSTMGDDFTAVVPTVIAIVLAYGHFLLAFPVYALLA